MFKIRNNQKMHGDVSIILRDKDGNIKQKEEGHNRLSKANQYRGGALAARYLNDQNLAPFGKPIIIGSDGLRSGSRDGFTGAMQKCQRRICLCNKGNKQTTEHYFPIFDSNGAIDTDVIKGWYTNARDAVSNTYQGVNSLDAKKQSMTATNKLSGCESRGFFDTDKANGTIDSVAVLSGFGKSTDLVPFYGGFSTWFCVSQEYTAADTNQGFVPPGVTGLTGENEILVYSPRDDISVFRLNFANGTVEPTNLIWAGSDSSINCSSIKKVGNDCLVYSNSSNSYVYIRKYNSDGTFSSNYCSMSDSNAGIYTKSTDPDYVYAMSIYRGNRTCYRFKYTDFENASWESYTESLGGLPSDWSYVCMLASNSDGTEFYVRNTNTNEVIICSDLNNIKGTIVATTYIPTNKFSVFDLNANTKNWWFAHHFSTFQDIFNTYSVYPYAINDNQYSNSIDGALYVKAFICPGAWSNWYNEFNLNEAMTKGDSDTADVSYWVYPTIT